MAKQNKKKMAYGGTLTNVESPSQSLLKHKKVSEDARIESQYDPLVQGLNMFAGMAINKGLGMVMPGLTGGIEDMINKRGVGFTNTLPGADIERIAAYGGTMGSNVEAEGGEIIETPDGQMGELNGPSHEQGGMNMLLPPGTDIFSDRLRGADGKTMAERKAAREKKEVKIQKLLEKDPTNRALKKALEKTQKGNSIVNDQDVAQMNFVQELLGQVQKFAYGGTTPDGEIEHLNMFNPKAIKPKFMDVILPDLSLNLEHKELPNVVPNVLQPRNSSYEDNPFILDNVIGELPTAGDALGILGNLSSAFGPMRNTIKARQSDLPEVNHMRNFGKKGLSKLQEGTGMMNQIKEDSLGDLELARSSSFRRNNNSARGINTQRALNLATDAQINDAQGNIHNAFAEQMLRQIAAESGQLNMMDQASMQGDAQRAENEVRNKDAFYTNLTRDIASRGTGIALTGKSLNDVKERGAYLDLLKQMYPDFYVDKNNQLVAKETPGINSVERGTLNLRNVLGDSTKKYTDKEGNLTKEGIKQLEDSGILKNKKGLDGKQITAQEYYKREMELAKNEFLPKIEELDTTYQTKVNPLTNKKFSSFSEYEKALQAGRTDIKDWNTFKGTIGGKDIDAKTLGEIENALQQYGVNVDTSNKKSVKALQKLLGFTQGKGLDGIFGKGTLNKLLNKK